MPGLDDETLARLCHLNYSEFSRELVRASGRDGAIEETGGLSFRASSTAFPVLFNTVWRLDATVPGAEVIERADEWFGARNRGFTINIRDDHPEDADLRAAADAAGLSPILTPPEMVVRKPVQAVPLPTNSELRWVDDPETLDDFLMVSDTAYASLGVTKGVMFQGVTDLAAFTVPNVRSVVAYHGGKPAATAQTVLSHGIAGVYWVGTVPEARGTGLGDAVTRAVTNRAFDEGARANTLQASPMGEKIYERMGYETLYRYTSFVRLQPVNRPTD